MLKCRLLSDVAIKRTVHRRPIATTNRPDADKIARICPVGSLPAMPSSGFRYAARVPPQQIDVHDPAVVGAGFGAGGDYARPDLRERAG